MIKKIKLNDNYEIPELGLGTWLIKGEDCYNSVLNALKIGYRHIDAAEIYGNSKEIGRAIKDSGVKREELFITTKIWFTNYKKEKLRKSLQEELNNLGIEYFDLVLLHRPFNNYKDAWKSLVEAKEVGLTRSIGVSNFTEKQLDEIIALTNVVPSVNQVECHPYCQRKELIESMNNKGIKLEAWYPLAHGDKKLINNEVFNNLAKKYNKSNVQIILKWHLQEGHIIFPKSKSIDHLKSNIDLYDFDLTKEDLDKISTLDAKKSLDKLPIFIQYPVMIIIGLISIKR